MSQYRERTFLVKERIKRRIQKEEMQHIQVFICVSSEKGDKKSKSHNLEVRETKSRTSPNNRITCHLRHHQNNNYNENS